MNTIILNLSNSTNTEIFIIVDKIQAYRRQNPNESKIILGGGIWYNVTQSPEEIRQKIEEASVELELIEGVEMKTESELTDLAEIERVFDKFGIEFERSESKRKNHYIEVFSNGRKAQFFFKGEEFRDFTIFDFQ